uniref:Uncharacterized protein n=1 Tax=Arundo donax TaxID=35708 RepID=A0A0A9BD17_ARUDO
MISFSYINIQISGWLTKFCLLV